MINKPFRPPTFRQRTDSDNTTTVPALSTSFQSHEPPAKKRRISDEKDDSHIDNGPVSQGSSSFPARASVLEKKTSLPRKPLINVRNPPRSEDEDLVHDADTETHEALSLHAAYYQVLWRKPTAKKHKTWDGDAVLVVRNGTAILRDTSTGKELGRSALDRSLLAGSALSMAGKEIEVDEVLKQRPTFGKEEISDNPSTTKVKHIRGPLSQPPAQANAFQLAIDKQHREQKKKPSNPASKNIATQSAFKNPLKDTTNLPQLQKGPEPVPRHDPSSPGALVMKRPEQVPESKQIVDVVVDPLLNKHLREHQRDGVKFLYECVMGLRKFDGEGAILADAMGLGKTLQTITLLWTLFKQNPIFGSPPVIKKALIVCPVTLINNWRKEFRKWLGNERIGVFVADGKKTRLTDFTMGKSYSVMIIGYERLRQVAEDLTKGAGIDIVIADEGHRLKTVQNKSAQAIQSLNTPKRVILSGTPIQNDLREFFSMVNFVNDGILGSYKQFVKQFENPIVRSRQPNALEEHIEQGQECSEELARLTTPFILRRTADLLSEYLPRKTEYVLFCEPLPAQAYVYRNVLASPIFQSVGTSENALQLITILKKMCNSPFLLNPRTVTDSDNTNSPKLLTDLIETLPPHLHKSLSNQASTKLRILDQFLDSIHRETHEKVVLVSNYTSTLDLLAGLLASNGLPFLRLDGSTPASKRQSLVDDFNRSSHTSCFAFLLSAKAGGMGLNLIGASRLILFDVDWNPATDLQAMARIHREGQKRECRIYRFIVKGSVEERIWQRQVTKIGLADSVMEMGAGGRGNGASAAAQFSRDELKDLFRLDESSELRTHQLLSCNCGGLGGNKAEADVKDEDEYIDIDALDQASGAATPALVVEDESSVTTSDDEDDIPVGGRMVKASEIDLEKQEKLVGSGVHPHQIKSAKGTERDHAIQRASLMLYQHIEVGKLPARPDVEDDDLDATGEGTIGDDVLLNILRSEGNRVKWVFKKTSEHAKLVTKDGECKIDKRKISAFLA